MTDLDNIKDRVLLAAAAEFAARGYAGASVDRIARAAGVSDATVEGYASRQILFDAAFTAHLMSSAVRVPFTAEDLPDYAVRLYDDYVEFPALPRLIAWRRLELDDDGYSYGELAPDRAEYLAAIAREQEAGSIRVDLEPDDVWALVNSAAATWAQVSFTEVAHVDDPGVVHRRRRDALAAFVRDGLF